MTDNIENEVLEETEQAEDLETVEEEDEVAKLTEQPIPEDWNEQRRLYGFPTR